MSAQNNHNRTLVLRLLGVVITSLLLMTSFSASAQAATPTASASPTTLTSSELGTTGTQLSGQGFVPEDVLNILLDNSPGTWGVAQVDPAGGVFFQFLASGVAPGPHTLTLVSSPTESFVPISITVLADPVPEITLSKSTISSAELATDGISLSGKNFEKYCTANATLAGNQFGYASCDENGTFSSDKFTVKVDAGTYPVVFDDGYGHQASAQLTVTGPMPANPVVHFIPKTASESNIYFQGITATGSGFPANRIIQIMGNRSGIPMGTVDSDASGHISYLLKGDQYPRSGGIRFFIGALSTVADLTVTPSLHAELSQRQISSSDLATQGITVHGKFFPVATKVTITLDCENPKIISVDAERNLNFVLKQAGVVAGEHTVRLSWAKSSSRDLAVDAVNTELIELPLTVTGSPASGPSQPSSPAKPAAVVAAAGTDQLANSGVNSAPTLLGLALIATGIGALLLARRRPTKS